MRSAPASRESSQRHPAPGRRAFPALGLALLLALPCPAPAGCPPPTFVDVAGELGIDFLHSFGDDDMSNIIESSGSGCAFLDYDNDGWLDLYVVNGSYRPAVNDGPGSGRHAGATNRLFRNEGGRRFVDVTDAAGVGDAGFGLACTVGDIDNDGRDDLYVTNHGRNTLYHNTGSGGFEDITLAAGVGDTLAGLGCTFLDFDRDGLLDLFVGNYVEYDPEYRLFFAADEFPGPLAYTGQPDVLYRNNGDLTFTDVTAAAGLVNDGRAMGVAAVDFDRDGWPDIFVANDAMENYLYRNNGDGTFTDVGLLAGVAYSANGDASSSMGGDFGDYDNDGDLDLLVPDMAFNNVYRSTGDGLFEDVTVVTGVAEISGQFVSWGGNFADFDNDGYLDVLLSNGDAHRLDSMETLLLHNVAGANGERVFRDESAGQGPWFREKSVGRGVAVADWDNDGDLDFFLVNLDRTSELLRNDGGNCNRWVAVLLVGTASSRDAIGAQVTVRSGELSRTAERRAAAGYLSQGDPRLYFGLGTRERVDEITVRWPSGATQTLTDVAANRVITITETTP